MPDLRQYSLLIPELSSKVDCLSSPRTRFWITSVLPTIRELTVGRSDVGTECGSFCSWCGHDKFALQGILVEWCNGHDVNFQDLLSTPNLQMILAWVSEESTDSYQAQIQRFLVIHSENDVSLLDASGGRWRVFEDMKNQYCLEIGTAGSQDQATSIRRPWFREITTRLKNHLLSGIVENYFETPEHLATDRTRRSCW